MGREKRSSERLEVGLPVRIIIRENASGTALAEAPGRISDISRHGLRLMVLQAKVGEFHLFFAFHDNEQQTIYLETQAAQVNCEEFSELTLPVRPVWFDRLLTHPDKPFQIGMEFLQDQAPEVARRLQKLFARRQGCGITSWWARLFGR